MFPAAFISGSRDIALHFTFRFSARATLERDGKKERGKHIRELKQRRRRRQQERH